MWARACSDLLLCRLLVPDLLLPEQCSSSMIRVVQKPQIRQPAVDLTTYQTSLDMYKLPRAFSPARCAPVIQVPLSVLLNVLPFHFPTNQMIPHPRGRHRLLWPPLLFPETLRRGPSVVSTLFKNCFFFSQKDIVKYFFCDDICIDY